MRRGGAGQQSRLSALMTAMGRLWPKRVETGHWELAGIPAKVPSLRN